LPMSAFVYSLPVKAVVSVSTIFVCIASFLSCVGRDWSSHSDFRLDCMIPTSAVQTLSECGNLTYTAARLYNADMGINLCSKLAQVEP
jgi:hypothetical protein